MTLAAVRKQIKALPIDDRLQLLDDIWFSVADDGFLPLTEAQRQELDRRWVDYKQHPETGLSLNQLKSRVARKMKSRRTRTLRK